MNEWVYQGNAPDESALRWSFIKTYSSFGGAGIPILGLGDRAAYLAFGISFRLVTLALS